MTAGAMKLRKGRGGVKNLRTYPARCCTRECRQLAALATHKREAMLTRMCDVPSCEKAEVASVQIRPWVKLVHDVVKLRCKNRIHDASRNRCASW